MDGLGRKKRSWDGTFSKDNGSITFGPLSLGIQGQNSGLLAMNIRITVVLGKGGNLN